MVPVMMLLLLPPAGAPYRLPERRSVLGRRLVPRPSFPIPLQARRFPGPIFVAHPRVPIVVPFLRVVPVGGRAGLAGASAGAAPGLAGAQVEDADGRDARDRDDA